jgi:hypothetical protein
MNQAQIKYAIERVNCIQKILNKKLEAEIELTELEEPEIFSDLNEMINALNAGEFELKIPDDLYESFYSTDNYILPKGYLEKKRIYDNDYKVTKAKRLKGEAKIDYECNLIKDSIALGTSKESVQALAKLATLEVKV